MSANLKHMMAFGDDRQSGAAGGRLLCRGKGVLGGDPQSVDAEAAAHPQPQPQDTQPRKEDTPNQLRDMMREMLRR
jgi:hypothetical protein